MKIIKTYEDFWPFSKSFSEKEIKLKRDKNKIRRCFFMVLFWLKITRLADLNL